MIIGSVGGSKAWEAWVQYSDIILESDTDSLKQKLIAAGLIAFRTLNKTHLFNLSLLQFALHFTSL